MNSDWKSSSSQIAIASTQMVDSKSITMNRLQSVKTKTCPEMNGYSSVIRVIRASPEITVTWKLLITDRVALVSSGIPGCSACRHGGSPIYSDGKLSLFIFRNQLRPIIITYAKLPCVSSSTPTSPSLRYLHLFLASIPLVGVLRVTQDKQALTKAYQFVPIGTSYICMKILIYIYIYNIN